MVAREMMFFVPSLPPRDDQKKSGVTERWTGLFFMMSITHNRNHVAVDLPLCVMLAMLIQNESVR